MTSTEPSMFYCKNLNLLFSFLILIIFASCEDAIDFEIPAGKANAIAIQGKLVYNEPVSSVEVLITDLFDFDGTPKRLDIRNVNIENEQGQFIELKSRNFELYTLSIPNSEFNIAINKAFRLNVILKNDTHIQSNFEHILAISSGTLASEISDVMIEDDDGEIVNERELKVVSTLSKLDDPDTKIKWDVRRAFRFTNFNSTKLSSDNFFCNTTQLDAAGLCDLLRKDPESSLALLDCDGGGISNSAECDRGNDPFNSKDDNVDDANIFRSCYVSHLLILMV